MSVEILDYSEVVVGRCFLIKGLYSDQLCDSLVKFSENKGFASADDKYPLSYRTNLRAWEDNESLSSTLYSLLMNELKANDFDVLVTSESLNTRVRYCKYQSSQEFKIHRDGVFYKDADTFSQMTFLLYLNESDEYQGGDTRFYSEHSEASKVLSIKGDKGDVLLFDHDLWHSGSVVESGDKYILRSDILFREEKEDELDQYHNGYIWKLLKYQDGFITASRDKSIKVWDTSFNLKQRISDHTASVFDCIVVEDSLFSVSRDGDIISYKKDVHSCWEYWKKEVTGHGTCLSINEISIEGDRYLITTGVDGCNRIWDKELNLLRQFQCDDDWIWNTLIIDRCVFSISGSGSVIKHEIIFDNLNRLSTKLGNTSKISNDGLRCLDSIGTNKIVIGDEGGRLSIMNAIDMKLLNSKLVHQGIIRDVCTYENSFITGGEDEKVLKVTDDLNSTQEIAKHSDFVTSLAVVEDGVYSTGYDSNIKITCI